MKFIIYSTDWCPYCTFAKRLLSSKGLDYEEINIDDFGIDREKLYQLTGGRTVPQILFDGKPIGGFHELQILESKGKLENI